MAALTANIGEAAYVCDSCKAKEAKEKEERLPHLRQLAKSVVLTTTHNIDGHRVLKYLGIESVEFVIGTGVFSEITTEVEDFFGQRSSAFEKKLQAAKKAAFETLTMLAAEKGANAVVGIDVDYTEFSGNRVGLVVNGTLVEIERVA
jgi:uncharacterized protein YbjQ (UPF0145 family)